MSDSPKIVATVLCGNAELFIGPAIHSVIDWVDRICVIDTGVSDRTIEIISEVAGDKASYSEYIWCNDFAHARNAALQVAERQNAEWALTLDTDERLDFSGFENKQQLIEALESDTDVLSWMVWARDQSYFKERFLRIPCPLQWQGRTHEGLYGATKVQQRILRGCRFFELEKTPEQIQHKVSRDLQILLEETVREPRHLRWWNFLGQTYANLKEYTKAYEAYYHCCQLEGGQSEVGWAAYSAASCLAVIGDFEKAEEICKQGIAQAPMLPELPWLAGWCCYQRGAWSQAVRWSELAASLTNGYNLEESAAFVGAFLRHMPAWYEGPYDVLRFAYQKLNQQALASQAELQFQAARAARLNKEAGYRVENSESTI